MMRDGGIENEIYVRNKKGKKSVFHLIYDSKEKSFMKDDVIRVCGIHS